VSTSVQAWLAALGILIGAALALTQVVNPFLGWACAAAALVWTAVVAWRWARRNQVTLQWPLVPAAAKGPTNFAVPGLDVHNASIDPRVRWFRCFHHVSIYTLRLNDDPPSVTVHLEVWRQIRNVSSISREIELSPAVDDWHIPGHPARVLHLAARVGQNAWQQGDTRNVSAEDHIYKARGLKVHVGPGELLDTEMVFEETKGISDIHWTDFVVPTLNPLVIVKAPDSLTCSVDFTHHPARSTLAQSPNHATRLMGVIPSDQRITLRWYIGDEEPASMKQLASPRSTSQLTSV
jgi:hypothetical protein